LESVVRLAPSRRSSVQALIDSLQQVERTYSKNLNSYYNAISGEANVPTVRYTEKEKELQAMKPALTAGPKGFQEARRKIKGVSGLHSLMAYETLNFIDGRRTGVEIYEAVSAEALQAGEYYYGKVTPEMVVEYLKNLSEAGLIKLN